MRKFYLVCSAVLAMFCSLNANAQASRILFTENYEDAASVADTKWTSPSLPDGLSVASDEFGKFLRFSLGQNNGRSAHCLWGHEIYEGIETNNYTVSYDFCINAAGNNQYNGNITVFTGETCELTNGQHTGTKEWGHYGLVSENWLFDMAQVQRDAEDTNTNPLYFMNNDSTDLWTPEVGAWYTVTINVDKTTRVAEYTIAQLGGAVVKSGSHTVSAEGNIDASGLCLMSARYQSITDFDNITVSVAVEGDYANDPVVALTGIMNEQRTYTISFLEGETLFIQGVDGAQEMHDYMEAFGTATYTTSTSGTFTVWTTAGSAESKKIETVVDASIIQVPAAEAIITAVEAGYSKTYTLTVDNSDVPLRPTIFINYTFKDANGTVVAEYSKEGVTSGSQVTLPELGTLEVVTEAYGYGANTTTIANNIAYKRVALVDFQHMTADDLKAKGFTELEPLISSTQSGESNWTGRRYLYFDQKWPDASTETGDSIHRVYVWGPSDETWINSGHTAEPAIQRFHILQSELDSISSVEKFGPVYLWCNGTEETGNVKINLGIGLINEGCKGNEGTQINYANGPMGVVGYTENDFVVVTKTNNYGQTSIHPVFEYANAEEANAAEEADIAKYKAMNIGTIKETYKGDETWNLYRIDTAVTTVEVFSVDGETAISDVINGTDKASDANAPIYDLRGVQVSKGALQKGIYIQNGKKFVVK